MDGRFVIKKGRYRTGLFSIFKSNYIGLFTKTPFDTTIEIATFPRPVL